MKYIIFLLLFTSSIFAQYTLPPFGAPPAEVWKYMNIDSTKIILLDTAVSHTFSSYRLDENQDTIEYISYNEKYIPKNGLSTYNYFLSPNSDSCTLASFVFHRDSLVWVHYFFQYRGDVNNALEFFEKKNRGYEYGHGTPQRSIKIDSGYVWKKFTLSQIAEYLLKEMPYFCSFYMPEKYRLHTQLFYTPEYIFSNYVVSFISKPAYNSGLYTSNR